MVDLSLKAPAQGQGVYYAGVPRAIRWLANPRWTDDSQTMLEPVWIQRFHSVLPYTWPSPPPLLFQNGEKVMFLSEKVAQRNGPIFPNRLL